MLYVILSLRESRSAPERGSFSQASMSFQGRGSRTAAPCNHGMGEVVGHSVAISCWQQLFRAFGVAKRVSNHGDVM